MRNTCPATLARMTPCSNASRETLAICSLWRSSPASASPARRATTSAVMSANAVRTLVICPLSSTTGSAFTRSHRSSPSGSGMPMTSLRTAPVVSRERRASDGAPTGPWSAICVHGPPAGIHRGPTRASWTGRARSLRPGSTGRSAPTGAVARSRPSASVSRITRFCCSESARAAMRSRSLSRRTPPRPSPPATAGCASAQLSAAVGGDRSHTACRAAGPPSHARRGRRRSGSPSHRDKRVVGEPRARRRASATNFVAGADDVVAEASFAGLVPARRAPPGP